jgi:hypothetical protein
MADESEKRASVGCFSGFHKNPPALNLTSEAAFFKMDNGKTKSAVA